MITLKTVTSLIQYHNSIEEMLAHYNRHGKIYELRGNELWHKGYRAFVGTITNTN